MNNNEEEFKLDFDEDVVDMTDLNRKNTGNTYGSNYNSTAYSDDIYGVYNPNRDRVKTGNINKTSPLENVLNILHYSALIICILSVSYFVYKKQYNVASYKSLMSAASIYMEIVFLVEAIVLYSKYKRSSLIVTAIFLPFLYPFFRCNVLGRTKKIPTLWLIAYLVVCGIFIKGVMDKYDFGYGGINKYPTKYEKTMNLFKNHKYDGKTKTGVVMNKSFNSYSLDVKVENEDNEYLYAILEGNAKVYVQDLEKPDVNSHVNTIVTFKVKKSDGSYSVTDLSINGNNYQAYAAKYWAVLYSNAGG